MRKKAKKPLVLLVDDSPGFIRLACRRLGDICQIITAENGKNAVLLLIQTCLLPDLIISDLDMPEMNGYQLLKYLKKTRLYKNIPFIILTENESYKTQCLEKGAVGYVIKSPSLLEVKKVIQEEIGRMKR